MAQFVTDGERQVVAKLADVWNAFLALPVEHDDDIHEFRRIIHAGQDKVLGRAGRREVNR
jgi:hypothetical protein